jgi:hypothetical protein
MVFAIDDTERKELLQEFTTARDAYLAALLTAHAELNGEETVSFIEKSYLQNRDRQLGELIAAVTALRVHGQADGKIPRSRIQASFHLLLKERQALLELIVEDCAHWKDWSFAAKMMEIYAGGKQPWNNAMIIKYLEACPLPEAKQFLQHLTDSCAANEPCSARFARDLRASVGRPGCIGRAEVNIKLAEVNLR